MGRTRRTPWILALALLTFSGGCSGNEEPVPKPSSRPPVAKKPLFEIVPDPTPVPPPPPPASLSPAAARETPSLSEPVKAPVVAVPTPSDPRKDFDEALAAGRLEEAARALEAIRSNPSSAVDELQARLERVRTVRAVKEAFESGRPAALERVREAREAVGRDLREESERDLRIAQALKELTDRAPLRVTLSENVTLEKVRVASFAGGRVKLVWPQGEVEYPLELLPEETRTTLLAGALAKATPRDHFEIGKLLVRGKDYERAARCFATAGQRDPALAPYAPDLERVKREARLFEGMFKASGNTLGITWSFSAAGEAKDFLALEGTMAVRPGQGLEVDGLKLALAAVKEIPFRDRVKVSALARETEGSAHVLGLRFTRPDGAEVLIYGALATSLKAFVVVRVEDGKSQELLAPTPGAAGNRMSMDFNRGRFTFQVGDRTVWSGNEGGFTDVTVIVGASAMSRAGSLARAMAQFREITLLGGVNPLWMTKKTAGLREALASELSKEFRAKRTEASAGSLQLSVEPAVARAAEATRAAYQGALAKVAAMRQSLLQVDLVGARKAMEQVTEADGSFAPAWYWRGVLDETGGDLRAAAEQFDRALVHLPDFPEASCARGRLHALSGRWDGVRECAERALALKPDLVDGHLLQARWRRESGDSAGALESARMARRLAPQDPSVQSAAQMLVNVLRGPSWPRPNVHATAHYSVRSDLPAAKCRLYAEHLEGVRPVYEDVLGRALPAGKPADVLLFDAEEGYFSYMDFTAGNRQEHTLGAFSPWHGQMALFEGVEPVETLRVLSHEGFHQALHAVAPDVPIWFNEGMAEYVGATRVEKGRVVERGGILSGRLDNLKLALKYGWSPLPFDQIMLESQADFYSEQAPFKYAQAWSMIRYFMDGDGGRWKNLLKDYTDRLLAGEAGRAAFDATFARQDLRQMEASWLKYYGLVAPAPSVKSPTPIPVPAVAPPADTTDLIALLLARGLPLPAGWKINGGTLESSEVGSLLIDLGYEPPAEYELRLVVQRIKGEGALCLGLQSGGRPFLLRLDDKGGSGLEALDGKDEPNESSRRGGPTLPSGRRVVIVCSVRKDGIRATIDGAVAVDWRGGPGRLSLPGSLLVPVPARTLSLLAFRTQFSMTEVSAKVLVPGPGAELKKPPAPAVKLDPARAIALESEITRWLVDAENDQILALEPSSNSLLQISLSQRKVLRRTLTGIEPVALCPAAGSSKFAWVASKVGRNVVKVDLEKGVVTDTIQLTFAPVSALAIRKYLWCLDGNRVLHGLDVEEKKDLGSVGFETFDGIGYDSRKDRLWALGSIYLGDYDASKIGNIQRELMRKNLQERERIELQQAWAKTGRRYPSRSSDERSSPPRLLVDEKNGKIYFNRAAIRIERPDLVLDVFKAPPHSLASDPAVKDLLSVIAGMDQIIAASSDGKWVASGGHVFNAATFTVQKELPVPTPLVAFSKDSKSVYYFDWINRAIGMLDVEPK